MHTLTAQRAQHLDALCADCHARTAVSPRRSSQPGVQSVQAPAVLRNHSSMEQLCHLCRALAVLAAVCSTSVCSPGAPSSSASCIAHPALDERRAERFQSFTTRVKCKDLVKTCRRGAWRIEAGGPHFVRKPGSIGVPPAFF